MTTLRQLLENPTAERLARVHLHFLWQGLVVAITIGVGFPWSATAADSPQAGPLSALRHDQIPAYEARIAGAVDPAAASPSLVAILGDSRLKMMEYVGRMVYTADGRSIIAAANHEIAFWNPRTGEQERVLRGHAGRVAALAMSLDGRTLVSGSYDHLPCPATARTCSLRTVRNSFSWANHR
jgi:hypothetical protein